MTEPSPTRATERITRRKELRQSRIVAAQRRRANRTRAMIAIAAIVIVMTGLTIWFAFTTFVSPPSAALVPNPFIGRHRDTVFSTATWLAAGIAHGSEKDSSWQES